MGADAQSEDSSALQFSMAQGDAETLELLLRAGMTPSRPSMVLHAVQVDSVECLLVLAHYGIDWQSYASALVIEASAHGCLRAISHILAQPLAFDRQALSRALTPAVRVGSSKIVALLLKHGADPANDNSVALKTAIDCGEWTMARLLIAAGARAADLPGGAFIRTFEAGELPLTIELLKDGVEVHTALIGQFTAERLTQSMPPEVLFVNRHGNPHPKPICESRLAFARRICVKAAMDEDEAAPATLWLAKVLAIAPHTLT
jgi:hypothetical protein